MKKLNVYKFVLVLPIFNLVFDLIVLSDVNETTIFPQLRAVALLFVVLYIWKFHIKLTKLNILLFVFLAYLLILIPFSSDVAYSLRTYIKVFVTMMMFPVGYYTITNFDLLNKLNKSMVALIGFFVLYTLVSTYFDIGLGLYLSDEDFSTGFIYGSGLYPITYAIILLPIINGLEKNRTKRTLLSLLAIASIIILMISLRRTAVLAIVVAYGLYFLFYKKRSQAVKYGVVTIVFLAITYPVYSPLLMERFEARFYEEGQGYSKLQPENQARFIETIIVYDEIFSFESVINSLFGEEVFNSPGHYGNGELASWRKLHVDFNVILHGAGIVGLFLYLLLHWKMISFYRRIASKIPENKTIQTVRVLFLSLWATSLFISLVGGMHVIAFRTIAYLYMGALLGLLHRHAFVAVKRKREAVSRGRVGELSAVSPN